MISNPLAPRTWIQLYATTGQQVALFDDWVSLEIIHHQNTYSQATLVLWDTDARNSMLTVDAILEVWRQVGAYKYIEYTGFHRVTTKQLSADQRPTFQSQSRGLLDLVHRRCVMYPPTTAFTLKQAPVETILKQIVLENVGAGAVSPPRFMSGVTPGFTVAADGAQGPTITVQLATDNVLDVLNKTILITDIQGDVTVFTTIDFDVVRIGPVAFEFRTYFPQRGQDKSATLMFAPELGNMVTPVYTLAYDQQVNSVAVLGPGQDSSRRILPVASTDPPLSPWNICEATVDASNQDLYEGMLAAGNKALADGAPIETFAFDPLAGDVALYGRDYVVGDIVMARFGTITKRVKVVGVTLTIRNGEESVKLDISTLV